MGKRKKTLNVRELVNELNAQIFAINNTNQSKELKQARKSTICLIIEDVLRKAGQYEGFCYALPNGIHFPYSTQIISEHPQFDEYNRIY